MSEGCGCSGDKDPNIIPMMNVSADRCCSDEKKDIQKVSTELTRKDIIGAFKVRLGIGRSNYRVDPGIYAVGDPNEDSPVLVSANYKLTFDTLRKNLTGLDCWLLILDTKGVNVWCAAGKGTFGTDELVNRIKAVGLSKIVTHRKLILPQLGASGVCAHEVTKRTGFSVIFGPVRASDIKTFIADGYKATEEMRTVKFTMRDRIVLTPVELVPALKKTLLIFGLLFLINIFAANTFNRYDVAAYLGAVLFGTVVTPALLPFIPGRAFAWKGWLTGLCWAVFVIWIFGWFTADSWAITTGYLLLLPAISAYLAMNFTGASTFTSPSGVLKEMKTAVPLILMLAVVGTAMVIAFKLM